ncbi:hypothetical protein GCM10010307_33690 [Streptomyces vastus]|uniref:Uncharacterized protein n=1 Tax=Streptomyces vastus TaxID=285451 RepID=A0ABN3QWL5_9ACTN
MVYRTLGDTDVSTMTFSPDDRYFAASDSDGHVTVSVPQDVRRLMRGGYSLPVAQAATEANNWPCKPQTDLSHGRWRAPWPNTRTQNWSARATRPSSAVTWTPCAR